MISFALSMQAKTGCFVEALAWAKERASWVSAQKGAQRPTSVHMEVSGNEHRIVFVQGFDSLAALEQFQKHCEALPEHQAAIAKGLREYIVEGSVQSTIYEQVH